MRKSPKISTNYKYNSKNSFSTLSRKRALITAEFRRVKRNTSAEYFHKALGMIINKFLSNGYPKDFINNTLGFKS